jgi:hypothetical protein
MSNDLPNDSTDDDVMTAAYLKRALKAFKKRLKLTRLDAESRIGGGPLSGGKDSGIVAIQAPFEYPRKVWEKLVENGRLLKVEGGLYEINQDYNPN